MIRFGKNGKIQGAYLLKNIIGQRIISIPEDGFVFSKEKCGIRNIAFADSLRQSPDLLGNLRDLTEQTVRLYYLAEEEAYFRVPMDDIKALTRPLLFYRDMSGMTFLNLFATGHLKLSLSGAACTVTAADAVLDGIPDAEEKIRKLTELCLMFSGDTAESITVGRDRSALFRTLNVGDGLRVTSDSPGECEELTEREQNVRRNFNMTMERLSSMMESLSENGE